VNKGILLLLSVFFVFIGCSSKEQRSVKFSSLVEMPSGIHAMILTKTSSDNGGEFIVLDQNIFEDGEVGPYSKSVSILYQGTQYDAAWGNFYYAEDGVVKSRMITKDEEVFLNKRNVKKQ